MNTESKKIINDLIDQITLRLNSDQLDDEKSQASFTSGSMKVSCKDTKEAMQALSKRLKKGLRQNPGTKVPKQAARARNPQDRINAMIDDGEIENAINLANLLGRRVYFRSMSNGTFQAAKTLTAESNKLDERFIFMTTNGLYIITHIDSGQQLTFSTNKRVAMEQYNELVKREDFEEKIGKALERFPSNAQKLAYESLGMEY